VNPVIGYVAIAAVALASALIGFYGLRVSRTTSDFYVASRTVRPWWNASAIGGEYLSAASFLGVAGLVLVAGTDMLWFPVGYTAGYLVLLVLVAAPLRRSGERLLLLLGASGSGKSSLVRAGVLPRLCRLPDRWQVLLRAAGLRHEREAQAPAGRAR